MHDMKVVSKFVMNAPNTKWSIVSNVLKPAINVLKNAGEWQINKNEVPLPAIQPAMEQST
jgi:predicted metalloprotease